VASGVGKNFRVTANWPGPRARALLGDGAALTTRVIARVERMDLMATILNVVLQFVGK
jgi:hypothetical protein